MFMGKLKNLSGGRILDVGTGVGELIPCIIEGFKDFREIVGIDSSDKALEYAGKRFQDERISFEKIDGKHMTFEDNSFDTVCISNTLHHLNNEDMMMVLKEMKRVLKPEGHFIICEMYCDNQNEKQRSHVLLHHLSAEIERINGGTHNDTFKRNEIIEIVNNLGLNAGDTWDYKGTEDEEPIPAEEIEGIVQSFTKRIEGLKENAEYERINIKVDELKKRLYEVGIAGATELVIVAKK